MDQLDICQQHNSEYTAFDTSKNELLCNGCLFTIQRLEEHILPLCEVVRHTKSDFDKSFNRYVQWYEKAKAISADKIMEQKGQEAESFFKDVLGEAERIKQIASQKAENSLHIQQMKEKIATNHELDPRLVEERFKEKEIFDKCIGERKYLYIVKRKQHYEQMLTGINESWKILEKLEKEIQGEMKDVAVISYKKDIVEKSLNEIFESQVEVDDSFSLNNYSYLMRPQIDSVSIPQQTNQIPLRTQNYTQSQAQNYAQAQAQNYAQTQAQNYAQPQAQNYAQPQAQNYAQSQVQNYAQPQAQNYAQPQAQNYAQSQVQNYVQPQDQSYSQPQVQNTGYSFQSMLQGNQTFPLKSMGNGAQVNHQPKKILHNLVKNVNIDNWENILEKIAAMKQSGYRPAATKESLRNSPFTTLSDLVSSSSKEIRDNYDGRISPNKQQQDEYLSESTFWDNQEGGERSWGEELQHQEKIDSIKVEESKDVPIDNVQHSAGGSGRLNLLASIFPNEVQHLVEEKVAEPQISNQRISLIPFQADNPQQNSSMQFGFNQVN